MFVPKILTACVLSSMFVLGGCQSIQFNQAKTSSVESVSVQLSAANMMQHLQAFEKIAKDNGGNRAVGTKGGLASAKYIIDEAKKAGLQAQMLPFENREKVVGQNIFVEIAGQTNELVVLIGAHYDSVKVGPGINDNASGVALLLDLMHQLKAEKTKPKHTIVLAFWDSEETGIAGSQDYVKKLSPEQLKGIKAYINVDMVGTKNPDVMIADATKSSVDDMEKMLKERGMVESDYKPLLDGMRSVPTHAGDIALENMLSAFFKDKKVTLKKDVSTLTASDTAPFLGKVPVTSIIMFNEKMNGDELEFAPCYHKACDTIEQVDPKSLQLAGDAVAYLLKNIQ